MLGLSIEDQLTNCMITARHMRVARGAYVTPVSSRFGTRTPAPEKVVEALAAQSGEIVVFGLYQCWQGDKLYFLVEDNLR